MKIEKGVMVIKNGKAWGIIYEDGYSTAYGWVEIESAPIHNSEYCTKPEHVTHKNSPDREELKSGKLMHVERITEVKILSEVVGGK